MTWQILEGRKRVVMGMLPSHAWRRMSCLYRTRGWRRGFARGFPWSGMSSMRFNVPLSSALHSLVHNAQVGRTDLRCNFEWSLWFCRPGRQWRICGCLRSHRERGGTPNISNHSLLATNLLLGILFTDCVLKTMVRWMIPPPAYQVLSQFELLPVQPALCPSLSSHPRRRYAE
jgi:hypothetical protein